ncbi:MAG: phosphate ABC transporter permease subunit PstC [Okeania sp. SIO2G4]|uniref:phosphate ABC transporter permease subunit PstC n=1 Tax=unclassified Okeania TaxID=2634635 RepID=UPI0013BD2CB1|nr:MULTISPECIES: phosphate ABC transporter permease subunit PstC [unclassified Okeania]NEP04768.1 phosphate ABC transporter permease subunit PstC [Okeania sp. SIO4D6]NEP71448.1 phosphate ABC transporter permease subunit PstC [Okeania sp. SIO2G5]NEP96182.1 phosphate ABC transporter permease subunit PstC [Okeania sp. SIO2F5]NEQ93951.1 phosphate ABC transporter permease subunit PstC [Okeania sp. SIO2G4]
MVAQSKVKEDSRSRTNTERKFDDGFITVTKVFAWGIAAILILIALTVAWQAIPAINEFGFTFLFKSVWNPVANDGKGDYGAWPMIVGTLISSFLALFIAVPLGLGTAIFLSEGFLPPKITTPLTFMVELLAAIPSVVYGLWGIYVLLPLLKPIEAFLGNYLGWILIFSLPKGVSAGGPGMFPAALVLSIMILPIITAISRDSLASLPPDLRQASMGIGATRWGTIIRVLIPAAFSGIVGGIMLGLGRAMGETMAVTMLIGNANSIKPTLFAPSNTIASLMANQFAEASGLQLSALMYTGIILFVLTLLVNILANWIVNRIKAKY